MRLVDFQHRGTLTELSAAFLATLAKRTAVRGGDGADMMSGAGLFPNYAGDGGAQRLAVLTNVVRPASGTTSVVIDSSLDWRDRLVWFVVLDTVQLGATEPTFPGADNDGHFWHAVDGLHYTHAGVAEGQGISGRHFRAGDDNRRIYARDTDGALMMDRSLSDAYVHPISFIVRAQVTEQLGERHTVPTALPAFNAVDAALIDPHDLNNVQDRALLVQAAQGPANSDAVVDSMPLGPVTHGLPRVPYVWTVRGHEARQAVAGAVRRWFTVQIDDGDNLVIDDSVDWRDRVIWGHGRVAISNILPGQAGDTGTAAGAPWVDNAKYTGAGETAVSGFAINSHHMAISIDGSAAFIYADRTTGALHLTNDTGIPRYVVGMLEGSFQLGPETPL